MIEYTIAKRGDWPTERRRGHPVIIDDGEGPAFMLAIHRQKGVGYCVDHPRSGRSVISICLRGLKLAEAKAETEAEGKRLAGDIREAIARVPVINPEFKI